MLHIAQTNHQLTRELTEKTITHVVGGHKGAAPLQLFGASQIEKAFRLIQSGANTGRVVLTLSPEEVVPRYNALKSSWRFREDGSYLVAGGLGGLGQAILRWMADKGAECGADTKRAPRYLPSLFPCFSTTSLQSSNRRSQSRLAVLSEDLVDKLDARISVRGTATRLQSHIRYSNPF
ncbi:hypothetical protein F5883DRAFT_702177 [Diaporthe sp. PMI_573]|nr:hypothetical protein F5883DRAFT_702177 [Diaporthaceae sp. PMI_573]